MLILIYELLVCFPTGNFRWISWIRAHQLNDKVQMVVYFSDSDAMSRQMQHYWCKLVMDSSRGLNTLLYHKWFQHWIYLLF